MTNCGLKLRPERKPALGRLWQVFCESSEKRIQAAGGVLWEPAVTLTDTSYGQKL